LAKNEFERLTLGKVGAWKGGGGIVPKLRGNIAERTTSEFEARLIDSD
jgi:hypothetical protein